MCTEKIHYRSDIPIKIFPTVKSNKPIISRRHFIKEPSCSFEGDTTCRRVITSNDIHEPCLSSCKPQLLLLIFSSHHDALEIASNKISQPELLLCFLWKTIKWCQNLRTQHLLQEGTCWSYKTTY